MPFQSNKPARITIDNVSINRIWDRNAADDELIVNLRLAPCRFRRLKTGNRTPFLRTANSDRAGENRNHNLFSGYRRKARVNLSGMERAKLPVWSFRSTLLVELD
jgi:hypothetical protein